MMWELQFKVFKSSTFECKRAVRMFLVLHCGIKYCLVRLAERCGYRTHCLV